MFIHKYFIQRKVRKDIHNHNDDELMEYINSTDFDSEYEHKFKYPFIIYLLLNRIYSDDIAFIRHLIKVSKEKNIDWTKIYKISDSSYGMILDYPILLKYTDEYEDNFSGLNLLTFLADKGKFTELLSDLIDSDPNILKMKDRVECNLILTLIRLHSKHFSNKILNLCKKLYSTYSNYFSINDVSINGNGYFHYAIESNNLNLIDYLLDIGVDINNKNNYGHTPLYMALADKNYAMVKSLIARGAKIG